LSLALSDRSNRPTGAITGFLFDLDGTLIDTTDLIFRSYQHALAEVTGRRATDEELYLGYGQPLREAFTAILEHQGITLPADRFAALVAELIETYRGFNVAHHDRLARPFPGVTDTLRELRERGYVLGLVTSKGRVIAERGLGLIGLHGVFTAMVFQEDTIRHKPHPDPVLVALDRLGRREEPSSLVFVGDSTHDLQAGRSAGVQTGAALWGPFPPASLLSLAPDHAFASVTDLLAIHPVDKR
jgi:pyrophosphatase PpaX